MRILVGLCLVLCLAQAFPPDAKCSACVAIVDETLRSFVVVVTCCCYFLSIWQTMFTRLVSHTYFRLLYAYAESWTQMLKEKT